VLFPCIEDEPILKRDNSEDVEIGKSPPLPSPSPQAKDFFEYDAICFRLDSCDGQRDGPFAA